MTSIASVSSTELRARRQSLRRLRRRQVVRSLWRILALTTLAGGLVWGASQPVWVIAKPEQIAVEGNHLLSDRTIRSLLSLTYPQSLLRIEPQAVASRLESKQSLIAKATVTRQLFPPSLTVKIEERQPVALALPERSSVACPPVGCNVFLAAKNGKIPSQQPTVGLLDDKGAWMPLKNSTSREYTFSLPKLKVIGDPERYLPYWSQFYQVLRRSPVKVFEVDWQDPDNLILKTELGVVHLGPYSSQLAQQLEVLDRMRRLSAKLNGRQLAYIDLRKPEDPAVQLLEPASKDSKPASR